MLRVRVQLLLTVSLVLANVIGAAVVVGVAALGVPGPALTGRLIHIDAIAIPIYVAVGLVVGGWWGTRRALGILRRVTSARQLTADERHAALRLPLRLTLIQLLLWGFGVVVFTVISAIVQPGLILTVPITISFGGIVVCAIAYLLSAFALRPIAARALASEVPRAPLSAGMYFRLLLFWCLGTGIPVAGLIMLALYTVVFQGGISETRLAITVSVIGGIVLVFGLLVTVLTSRAFVAPIHLVREGMANVERGVLDVEVAVFDGTELGLLQAGFNGMVRELRDREHLRDLFGRHVGQEVAAAALANTIELGGEVREVSVIFVDLAGSTRLATEHPATDVVDLLNRFFAVVVDEIDAHHGLVNKFIGDAVLAVFGAPTELADHAGNALAAARVLADRLPVEVPECVAGIGVAAGQAVAGNVGDRRRFEYTVIGDPVNEASRLTELAKNMPGRLVASGRAVALAGPAEAAQWTTTDSIILRGRTEPTVLAVPKATEPVRP
ncbi:MAG TPA: adenylate/guanylate cyclase domain-containing protein [Pseudonocardiaceae bacterium]